MNLSQLNSNGIQIAQKQIWNTLRSDRATQLSFEFERLSEHLTQLQVKTVY